MLSYTSKFIVDTKRPVPLRLTFALRSQAYAIFLTLDDFREEAYASCMDEKRFYDEKEETKQMPLMCPHCRQENSYPVRWMVRSKKAQVPGGANDQDKQNFAKARSYMVRVDNMVACRNIKCRKRFDLTGQTVFLI